MAELVSPALDEFTAKIVARDCETLEPHSPLRTFCEEYVKLKDKQEVLDTHLYITAGILGGAVLILIILVILLFVKINNQYKDLESAGSVRGDELRKRGYSTYTGRPEPIRPSVNTAFPMSPHPPPYPPNSGHNNPAFDVNSNGGVRVLPRNPPALRTHSMNDKFY